VIRFPETARVEWETAAGALAAEIELRKKIHRGTLVEAEVEKIRVRHEASEAFQKELEAESTPDLEIGTLLDYNNNPTAAPRDLIDGVLKDNSLLIVLGPSSSGKSTNALTMLHSLLTGEPWLGQRADQLDGSVGVVSYDMDASMLFDWMHNWPNVDPSRISVVNAHKRGNPLGVPAMRAQIISAWKAAQVEVIVIDSFSASFFGHDQNDAAATMSHYRDLQSFAHDCGARALIVIAHSQMNDPNTVRGSKVHHDVADSILSVTGVNQDPRKLHMAKYREAIGQTQMGDCIITAPDAVTHLVGLDYGAMSLAGMALPPSAAAQAFQPLPETNEDPKVEESDEEGDL
jgi:hypothetical protein